MKGKRVENGEIIYENSLVHGVYAGSDAEGAVAGNFSNRWPVPRDTPRTAPGG